MDDVIHGVPARMIDRAAGSEGALVKMYRASGVTAEYSCGCRHPVLFWAHYASLYLGEGEELVVGDRVVGLVLWPYCEELIVADEITSCAMHTPKQLCKSMFDSYIYEARNA